VIANFHGANSRINLNSTDNSSNAVVHQVQDLSKLADEFMRLREALLVRAKSAEDYAAIGIIANGELAAKSGEQPQVSALGSAARWVLDTAKEIGVQIATEVVRAQVGL
jgi:co-chaperonin GroES (HSP10)